MYDSCSGAVRGSSTPLSVVTETGPLDYTARMGLRPGSIQRDGTVMDQPAAAGARSCLIWESPELKLSLGDGPLARLVPPLWVPVAASCCVHVS